MITLEFQRYLAVLRYGTYYPHPPACPDSAGGVYGLLLSAGE